MNTTLILEILTNVYFQHKTNLSFHHKVKREYYKSEIDDCSGSPELMWSILNQLINGNNDHLKNIVCLKNNLCSNPKDIAENFNIYSL